MAKEFQLLQHPVLVNLELVLLQIGYEVASLVRYAGVKDNQPGFGGELGPDHARRGQHRQRRKRDSIVTEHNTPIESWLSAVADLAAVPVSLAHGDTCRHVPDSAACNQ